MWRARVETTMAGIAAVLTVVTFIWPTWIESLTGLEPDGGTGETEWWLALIFAVAALALSLMARRDRRIALGRSSMADAG
jgi:hypothetical protein